jgi:modulator of FtsH protease
MNNAYVPLPTGNPSQYSAQKNTVGVTHCDPVKRVLRNTYALLAMTLLFSAGVAVATLTLQLPAPGLIITLVGYFGLLFAVHKLQNSGWALPGGTQTITLALATTGATFLSLSSYVLLTRRDFSFMGGFLFVGMVIALIAGVAAIFLEIPALGLAVSAMVALLSAGLILFETSRIVNGGETNYVMATVMPNYSLR